MRSFASLMRTWASAGRRLAGAGLCVAGILLPQVALAQTAKAPAQAWYTPAVNWLKNEPAPVQHVIEAPHYGDSLFYFFQSRYGGEKKSSALIKSIIAGVVVGIPIPLAGSFVGGWILLNSGLQSLRDRLLRRK